MSDPDPHILVVEDNALLAEVLCDYLRDHRLIPVGPAGRVETACSLARSSGLDAAIVDLKLAEHFSFPVCTILAERGVPFLFLTGYDELSVIPTEFRSTRLLSKPFLMTQMHEAVLGLLQQGLAGRIAAS